LGEPTSDSDTDTPLYEKNDDGSYTFYSYDAQDRVIATLEVKAGALTVTNETTFENAEAVAYSKTTTTYKDDTDKVKENITLKRNAENVLENSSKEEYNYNTQGSVETYILYSGVGNDWQQNCCEEYKYNAYGNNTQKTVTVYTGQPNAEGVRKSTITVTDYTYDVWNQPVETTESVYADNIETTPTSSVLTKTEYDILGRTVSVTEDGKTTSYTYDVLGRVTKVTEGEEVTAYTYSDNGNLIKRINPNETVANYSYDSFGNLTAHDYNGYAFTYNTLGSILTAKTGEQSIAEYTYSTDTKQEVLNANFGNGQSVNYTYDDEGRIIATKLGEETKYGYGYFDQKDENGKITKEWSELTDYVNNLKKVVEESKTTVNDISGNFIYSTQNVSKEEDKADSFDGVIEKIGDTTYTLQSEDNKDIFKTNNTVDFEKIYKYENDNLSEVKIGGMSTSYGYTADKMISLLTNKLNDVTKSYGYKYDKNGNIKDETLTTTSKGELGETVESTEVTEYTYDEDNQLTSTENSTTKWEYGYDGRGNILNRKEYTITVDTDGQKIYTEKEDNTYSYDATWKDKLASYNNQSISYDASGNPTSYLGHNLTWTMGRQLASFDGITYTYNDSGIRTSKTSNGVTTKYYLDGTNIIEQTDGTNVIRFIYDRNNVLIGFSYNGNNYFYVKNASGVITDITNSNGNIVASYNYDPWGKVLSVSGDSEIGNLNPFRYKDYYYDSDIQMYYLQSRYYDADVGRFINCDDVNYIGTSESEISYNPFAYCMNNPVLFDDPTGTRVYAIGFQLDTYVIFGASFSIQLVWDSNGDVGILVFASAGAGWSVALTASFKVVGKYNTIFQLKGISRAISGCINVSFVTVGGTYSYDSSGKGAIYVNVGIGAPMGPVGGSYSYGSADLIYLFNYKKSSKKIKKIYNVLKALRNMTVKVKGRRYKVGRR